MQPGSFVRDLKQHYIGLCIVLKTEGTRVRMWLERGQYDVEATRAQLVESSPESAIFGESPERLIREYENSRRRKQLVEYNSTVKLAQQAMRRGDFAAAIAHLTKALHIEPDSYDALTDRAYCRRMMREYENSIEDL